MQTPNTLINADPARVGQAASPAHTLFGLLLPNQKIEETGDCILNLLHFGGHPVKP